MHDLQIISPDDKSMVVYHNVSNASVATMIVGAHFCMVVLG